MYMYMYPTAHMNMYISYTWHNMSTCSWINSYGYDYLVICMCLCHTYWFTVTVFTALQSNVRVINLVKENNSVFKHSVISMYSVR